MEFEYVSGISSHVVLGQPALMDLPENTTVAVFGTNIKYLNVEVYHPPPRWIVKSFECAVVWFGGIAGARKKWC